MDPGSRRTIARGLILTRLFIAAKAPRPGFVKTRLARAVGADLAARIYSAFLHDLAKRFKGAGWFVTPDGAWPEIAAAAEATGHRPLVVDQGEGTWGTRQDRLFATVGPTPADPVVLIASDSPQLGVGTVAAAFEQLKSHDLVFGPVPDGGYYLVGMSSHHDLLVTAPMSSPGVLRHLLGEATRRGLSVALLEPEFDVDEVTDLLLLDTAATRRPDLAATRAAIAELETAG
ncbi:MAG: hypothetical protein NVS9B1_08810 [Candidatus Dormibacteraceae bacterium]